MMMPPPPLHALSDAPGLTAPRAAAPDGGAAVMLSILIPMFNEAGTIRALLQRILDTPFAMPYEIILVDDRSTDDTLAVVRALQAANTGAHIRVITNPMNEGKGASIRRGFTSARGEFVIVQDGDLEYDPRQIPQLLQPLLEGHQGAVYGSRFLTAQGRPEGMAWLNYLANRLLTWLTNGLYRTRLTDMETCYKALRRCHLTQLELRSTRFEFEPEITAQLARSGIPIIEIPIGYRGRTAQEGKKIRLRDFFIAVWTLVRYRFR